ETRCRRIQAAARRVASGDRPRLDPRRSDRQRRSLNVGSGRLCATAEPRRARVRQLVTVAERRQTRERVVDTAVGANRERVEAALQEIVELVALHVTDRTELSRKTVALAQEATDRVTATIGELREIDRDQ